MFYNNETQFCNMYKHINYLLMLLGMSHFDLIIYVNFIIQVTI